MQRTDTNTEWVARILFPTHETLDTCNLAWPYFRLKKILTLAKANCPMIISTMMTVMLTRGRWRTATVCRCLRRQPTGPRSTTRFGLPIAEVSTSRPIPWNSRDFLVLRQPRETNSAGKCWCLIVAMLSCNFSVRRLVSYCLPATVFWVQCIKMSIFFAFG